MNTIDIYAGRQHKTINQNEFRKAVIKNSKEFIISENEKTLLREFIISSEMSLQLEIAAKSAFGYKTINNENNIYAINSFHKEFFGDNYFSEEGILPYEEYERKRTLWLKLFKRREPIVSRYFFGIAFHDEIIAVVPCEQIANFISDIGIHGIVEDIGIIDVAKISIHRIGKNLTDDFSFSSPIVSLEKAFELVAKAVLR